MATNRKLRFGIGAMFFTTAVVAGYFWGLHNGEAARFDSTLSTISYRAPSILPGEKSTEEQLSEIENLIRSTIAPASWIEQGGMASLETYPSNKSIVVTQYGHEHKKIGDLLNSLEKIAKEHTHSNVVDVSQIFETADPKPNRQQLDALCSLIKRKMTGHSAGEYTITPDELTTTIKISGRKEVHRQVTAYLEQLRHAREAFDSLNQQSTP